MKSIRPDGDKSLLLPCGSKITNINANNTDGETGSYHEQIFNQSKSKLKAQQSVVRWSRLPIVLSVAAVAISIGATGLCLFTQLSVSSTAQTTDTLQMRIFRLESELAMIRNRFDETAAAAAHTRQKRSASTTECSCPPGPPGPKGSSGPRGQNGAKGAKGEKGEFQLQLDRASVRRRIEVDGQIEEVEVYTDKGSMLPFFSFKGNRGLPGIPGMVGPPGEKGVPGEPGVGVAGPAGPKGERGDRGERGFPGPNGTVGAQGEKGERGEMPGNFTQMLIHGPPIKAEKGEKGESGSRGPRGKKGEVGQRGLVGNSGKIGLPGRPGEVGPPGPVAERGEKGEKGECLQKFIYQNGTIVLLSDSDSSTSQSFSTNEVIAAVRGTRDVSGNQKSPQASPSDVRYIQGPPGPPGPRGPKGDRGDRGDRGSMGLPGQFGAPGSKGEMGPKGEKGDQVSNGPRAPKQGGAITDRRARQTPQNRKAQRQARVEANKVADEDLD